MGRRYDASLSFDATPALRSLRGEEAVAAQEPETYPWSV
jgi:hypothetical protein